MITIFLHCLFSCALQVKGDEGCSSLSQIVFIQPCILVTRNTDISFLIAQAAKNINAHVPIFHHPPPKKSIQSPVRPARLPLSLVIPRRGPFRGLSSQGRTRFALVRPGGFEPSTYSSGGCPPERPIQCSSLVRSGGSLFLSHLQCLS